MNGTINGKFDVTYFDSSNNSLIQIADVFANLLYSHLQTGGYDDELIDNLICTCYYRFTNSKSFVSAVFEVSVMCWRHY